MTMKTINFLLYAVVIEISLGGGGRFTSVGNFSIRMFLFVVSMVCTAFLFQKIKKEYLGLTYIFFLIQLFSFYVGIVENAEIDLVLEDVKILSYFPMLLFYSVSLDSQEKVDTLVKLIKISSVFLSISYIITYWGLQTEVIDKQLFYEFTYDYGELFFRNEYAFLYKGLLFSSIGCFFFFFRDVPKNRMDNVFQLLFLAIIIYAVFITYTRGLLISVFLSGLIGYVSYTYSSKQTYKIIFFAIPIVLFLISSLDSMITFFSSLRDLSQQDESDLVRVSTFNEVVNAITPLSIFIGHGFGIGVASRPIHMEISYLEIFHKQGILGILFYLLLLKKVISNYIKVAFNNSQTSVAKMQALSFTCSSIFVYIQSASNPLLNNPIGISVVIMSIVSTDIIRQRYNVFSSTKMY